MTTPSNNPFAVTATEVTPPVKDDAHVKHGHVSGTGKWIFDHHNSFGRDNPVAWYGLRNVAINMVGIAGLIATIVPVRMAMGHGARWAEQKGYNFLSHELSRTFTQNAIGVGASFATFRTTFKTLQRSYDDVFVRPKNAEETSQAVHELPKKLFQNFKQIGVVEYPVTMIGGFTLVGIRSGIAGIMPAETLAKKKFGDVMRDKNSWRDTMGCAFFAYPAFFEIIEHMGRAWQKKRGYEDPYHNEHINKDKQGMKETFLRQIPGVAAGIIPYISVNTWARNNIVGQQSYNTAQRGKPIDGFFKGYKAEMPYQYFWLYTLGLELYRDAYDKLTGNKTAPVNNASIPSSSIASATPTHHVEQVDAQGKAAPQAVSVAV